MTTAPIPQSSPMPLSTESDLDAVAEQLFRSIQLGFDRPLVLRLEPLPGIDIARAETELRLVDLFAVNLAIQRTDCERWRHTIPGLCERVTTRVLTSWAPAWDTTDDVLEVVMGRFAAYSRLALASVSTDLNDMSLLVGVLCAVIVQGDRRVFADDAKIAGEAFTNVVRDLTENDNILHTTAATVFRTRFDAVSELLLTLSN